MNKDANLYERKYKNIGQINSEIVGAWKELIGESGINYIKQHFSYALEDDIEYIVEIKKTKYNKLKKYYMSHCISEDTFITQHYSDKNLGYFFLDFLSLIYKNTQSKIKNSMLRITKVAILNYLDMVYDKFSLIAARTIIFDMNLWNQQYSGYGTAENLYSVYCKNFLSNREYRISFYEEYPAVFRSMLETTIYAIDNYGLFLKRIEKDKREIQQILCDGMRFTCITNIEGKLSDSHCGGKNVLRLKLDNGKSIVYKQHSTKNEIVYQEIAEWFGEKCGITMYSYKCLDYVEYGWTEYVTWKPCKNIKELSRYYSRIGIHIFLCYLLNTSDIHAENLIAHGEYPVIIDMETITTPNLRETREKLKDKMNYIIHRSVLHSGILPFHIWAQDNCTGIDISALNGAFGQRYPIKVPIIINPFRIDMKIDYIHTFSKTKCSSVRINNKYVHPFRFRTYIIDTFKISYQLALKNRLKVKMMLDKIEDNRIRFVIRNSQQYAMLLSSSFHPRLTQDSLKRHMFFYVLCSMSKQCNNSILEAEIKDLFQGDLPYFYFFLDDTNLYDSRNEMIKDFFNEPVRNQLYKKLEILNQRDLEQQCRFIEISLCMMRYSSIRRISEEFKIDIDCRGKIMSSNNVFILMDLYGDYLLNTAIYNNDNTDVNWIGVKMENSHRDDWCLAPANLYFYNGKCGIAFYLHLLKKHKTNKYNKICDILDKNFFRHTEELLEKNNVSEIYMGAFYGEASILYLYELCYKLYKQTKYLEYCRKQAMVIKKLFKFDNKYDFLFGNAGAIVVILNLFDLTVEYEFLSLAIEMGNFLLDHCIENESGISWKSSVSPYCLAGLSHGNSGFALAFANLYSRTRNNKYLCIIKKILTYENSLFDASEGNWKDLRRENSYANSWCHGAAGILLGRIKLYELLRDTYVQIDIEEDIRKAAQKVMKQKKLKINCLCHGNMGNISILYEYGKRMKHQRAIKLAEDMFNMILNQFSSNNFESIPAFEAYNPGFMIGATGIYYALWKHYVHTIPNVLLLEI